MSCATCKHAKPHGKPVEIALKCSRRIERDFIRLGDTNPAIVLPSFNCGEWKKRT